MSESVNTPITGDKIDATHTYDLGGPTDVVQSNAWASEDEATKTAQKKKRSCGNGSVAYPQRTFRWILFDQLVVESNRSEAEKPESMTELAASIAACGILDPVHIRFDETVQKYRVTAGRRRVMALDLANKLRVQASLPPLKKVPCILSTPEDKTAEVMIDLITNYARKDLTALDKARLLKQAAEEKGCTAKDLAQELKLSPGTISEALSLLDLPDEALERIRVGESAKLMGRTWRKLPAAYQKRVAAGESLKAVIKDWKSATTAIHQGDNNEGEGRGAKKPADSLQPYQESSAVEVTSRNNEVSVEGQGMEPGENTKAALAHTFLSFPGLLVPLAKFVESEADIRTTSSWCAAIVRPATSLGEALDHNAARLATEELLKLLKDRCVGQGSPKDR